MPEKSSVVIEEYLQIIYQISLDGSPVKAIHIATRLDTSPSTVHATLTRMQRDGLVKIDAKKHITFTETGEERAKEVVFRHNLAEHFLCHTLGIPWYEVHKHAHLLEHAMTPLVTEKLAEFLGHPETCPHGTPLPNSQDILPKNLIPLKDAQTSKMVRIVMIDEFLEDSEDLLKLLHDNNIIPTKEHLVKENSEMLSSVTLEHDANTMTLPFDIAKHIKVVEIS